jgi:AcrR family transcriptional regulator
MSETRRPALTRDRVLVAAVELADQGGLESVSMRKVAAGLGVEAMSLYHHVEGKEDLLHGMLELVVAEMEVASPEQGWKEALRSSAISAHEVLVRHRWAAGLMMSAGVGTARLGFMEGLLATLRRSGFSAELTHHAYHALDSHIVGFTLWQVSLPPSDDLTDLAADFLSQLDTTAYPYFAEHVEQHLGDTAASGAEEFAFGLDLLLDGLERLRDEA